MIDRREIGETGIGRGGGGRVGVRKKERERQARLFYRTRRGRTRRIASIKPHLAGCALSRTDGRESDLSGSP